MARKCSATRVYQACNGTVELYVETAHHKEVMDGACLSSGGNAAKDAVNAGQLSAENNLNSNMNIPTPAHSNAASLSPHAHVTPLGSRINPNNTLQSFVQQPRQADAFAKARATAFAAPVLPSGNVINAKNTCRDSSNGYQKTPRDGKARAAAPSVLTT